MLPSYSSIACVKMYFSASARESLSGFDKKPFPVRAAACFEDAPFCPLFNDSRFSVIVSFLERSMARWIAFSSSLMLPGYSYCSILSRSCLGRNLISLLNAFLYFFMKCVISRTISSFLSRRGGRWRLITFRR